MARSKLVVDYKFDFHLFGLICDLKEYRLAWLLNRQLGIHLIKQKDIEYEFLNDEKILVSNYLFETDNAQFRLLKNKSENKNPERIAYLLPELHKFDFFIIKHGILDGKEDVNFFSRIRDIDEIQYITSFDISKIKSKENLIF